MIKLGDKVRFLNDKIEGVVTSLKGNIAGVTNTDGFEIPVVINELVKIDIEINNQTEQSKAPIAKSNLVKLHSGIHIAFDRKNDNLLELILHNAECDLIQFAFYHKSTQVYTLVKSDKLELNHSTTLMQYQFNESEKLPVLVFQIILSQNESETLKQPLTLEISIKGKDFHRSFGHCFFLQKQAYVFQIDDNILTIAINKLQQKDFSERQTVPSLKIEPPSGNVIDLHIEKIIGNASQYTAAQIIDMQISTFHSTLQNCFMNKEEQVVFIHGVGNNYLKNKIRNLLSKNEMVESMIDADPLKYGDGATLVFLR
jgi:hypothetical protein